MPEDEDAMTTSGRVAASISPSSLVFRSTLSGAFCLRRQSSRCDVGCNTDLLNEVNICIILAQISTNELVIGQGCV